MFRSKYPQEIGLLCAEIVLPLGPASPYLEASDILISINDILVTQFVPLEEFLDSNVGSSLMFKVERGGEELMFPIPVHDLHLITPDRYVEFGGATFNNLSYQLARQFSLPVHGTYLCAPGGTFRLDGQAESGWIIDSVNTVPTPDLDSFINAVKDIPDRERVPVTYHSIVDVHNKCLMVVNIERHWSKFRMAVRNDVTGYWDFTQLGNAIPSRELKPLNATFIELNKTLGPAQDILRSLAKITVVLACKLEGFPHTKRSGSGLVIDAVNGLIIVGRNILPYNMGDIHITFADSLVIPGQVAFIHPTENIALIKYDPKLIGTTPVKSAPISDLPLSQGDKVTLVGIIFFI